MIATQEFIVSATQNYLSARKKSLSISRSLDLFTQVLAVDLGLKPALLYDANSASSEQVQQYLNFLQSSQMVSKSLFTLDLNGNTLIVNQDFSLLHLNEILSCGSVVVVNVSHLLKAPVLFDPSRGELMNVVQKLQVLIQGYKQHDAPKPLYVGEHCEDWNLCTVFGALLGYPVTYWFDQSKSFENCLSMTPLMVTTASAMRQTDNASHSCCLFSFSVPVDLFQRSQSILKRWNNRLQERFEKQHVLTDLTICQTTVTMASVCL
ncbi:hypothetical protein NL108_010877 [Boleophthalmus pectinirostris]|uniref:UPF0739 protein C1orf74 homolog n=1 Tax=Boleophthalmus pectinirostris TaxID=150288 RepID=UPI000A1C4C91|nr:UPF0739 protein C1orf74 homolog [Boleophthalmus pectinirostris]KAJ0068796.1 hypothetical protein NL108_010877 [Boleophthalmus pectinirostris]